MSGCLSYGLRQRWSKAVEVRLRKFESGVAAVELFGPVVAEHASAQLFARVH